MTAINYFERASRDIPVFPLAHWCVRLPLAWIIIYQGQSKIPLSPSDAEAFVVPYFMWIMACLGELTAGALLIIGGIFHNHWIGHLATRVGGLFVAIIVASVLVWVYGAPIMDLLLYEQFHVLLMLGGLYFALRGNEIA